MCDTVTSPWKYGKDGGRVVTMSRGGSGNYKDGNEYRGPAQRRRHDAGWTGEEEQSALLGLERGDDGVLRCECMYSVCTFLNPRLPLGQVLHQQRVYRHRVLFSRVLVPQRNAGQCIELLAELGGRGEGVLEHCGGCREG